MSLITHLAVLGVLIVDLLIGAKAVERFWGRWPAVGFEFLIVLGYVLFVLQWGVPWGRRDSDDR